MAARAQGPPRYKAILVGDVGVGKTSIWRALHTDPPLSFLADTSKLPQIDLDTYSYQVQTDSGQTIVLDVVDTGGEEKYQDFTAHKFQHGSAVVFVYAIDNNQSFESLLGWIGQASKDFLQVDYSGFVMGNKDDLSLKRIVDTSALGTLVRKKDMKDGWETSAKDGADKIREYFRTIALTVHNNFMSTYY